MIALKENSPQQINTKLPNRTREPGLLQTIWAIVRPLDYLETMQERYGDIFYTEIPGFRPQVMISNPQAIQEIFTADSKLFESGSGSEIIQPLLGSNSLILLDGERHTQQRKLLMPPFHGERMRAYGQLISDIAKQVINQWKIGDVFKARSSMQEISLTVILRAVFGLKEGERYQEIRKTLTAMLDSFESPLSATLLFFIAWSLVLPPVYLYLAICVY